VLPLVGNDVRLLYSFRYSKNATREYSFGRNEKPNGVNFLELVATWILPYFVAAAIYHVETARSNTSGTQTMALPRALAISSPTDEDSCYDEGLEPLVFATPFVPRLIVGQSHSSSTAVLLEAAVLFSQAQAKHIGKDYHEAYAYYQQAIDMAVFQTNSSDATALIPFALQECIGAILQVVIPSLANLGTLAYHKGDLGVAASYLELAMTHAMAFHGNDSYPVARILNSFGMVLFRRSVAQSDPSPTDSDAAVFFLLEALRIIVVLRYLKVDHRVASSTLVKVQATICNNLGRVYLHRRDYSKALMYFEIALQLRCDLVGAQHLDTVYTFLCLGQALHALGDDIRALSCFQHFLDHEALHRSSRQRDGT
jgi:Tetratricopeptide repeat